MRCAINKFIFLSLNICLVSANDVISHFAFPGNIDFAADDQRSPVLFMKGWCVYSSMKQCLQSVNHEQFLIQMTQDHKHNKWLEILDFQLKLLWRTPTKIRGQRRRRPQQEAACKAQRTSLSPAKATSSTQWRQNTTITLQLEPMKRENTDCRRFKKRWGDQATLTIYSKVIFFDATIGSNSYTICTIHIKHIFPTDWGQPISLYTMSNIGFYCKLYFTMNSL